MEEAAIAVTEALGTEFCKFFELYPENETVILREGIGWRDGIVGSTEVPIGTDSQAGHTLSTEEPVIVQDLSEDDRFSGPVLLTSHNIVSGISVIIGSMDEPWGVLGTHSTENRFFTEEEANFVQSVANIIASAIKRRESDRELERAIDLFEKTEQIADVGGWEIYTDSMDVFWSNSLFNILQYPADEESPLEKALDVYLEDDRERVATAVIDALQSGQEFDIEARIARPDGDIRWLWIQGNPRVGNGTVVSLRGVVQDITEQKVRELELEQYKTLTEAANDVIVTIDEDSTIQTINPAVETIFGYDPNEIIGKSLTIFMPEKLVERHRRAINEYLTTGERTRDWNYVEMPGQHEDGSEVPLAMTFSEVEFEGDHYFNGVIRDNTEWKEYERALEASHERLEQFAAAVSHDLKEPLSTVASYLQLLERRYENELDETATEFIDYAVDSATRMREIIDAIVQEYAHIESTDRSFGPVDLNQVNSDVLVDLERKIADSRADITKSELPVVIGDRSQLHQVLLNLIDNAIKYSGEEPPTIHVSSHLDGKKGVIAVRDEGIGIDPEAIDSVFDVFYRLHDDEAYPGTGIGLALCERIVSRHGGQIWVDSEPGSGSTFYFTVTLAE